MIAFMGGNYNTYEVQCTLYNDGLSNKQKNWIRMWWKDHSRPLFTIFDKLKQIKFFKKQHLVNKFLYLSI